MSDETGGGADARDTTMPGESGPDVDVETVVAYLQWGALVAFGLLAVVAGVGLYTSLSTIIDVWVAARYEPFARVAFNAAVLCVAGAGIVAVVRRL